MRLATLALLALGSLSPPAAAEELRFVVTQLPEDPSCAPSYVATERVEIDGPFSAVVEHADGVSVRAWIEGEGQSVTWTRSAVQDPNARHDAARFAPLAECGARNLGRYAPRPGDATITLIPAATTVRSGLSREELRLPSGTQHLAYDPQVLTSLAPWAPVLAQARAEARARLSALLTAPRTASMAEKWRRRYEAQASRFTLEAHDLATGKQARVQAYPGRLTPIVPPPGTPPHEVQAWSLRGLPTDPLVLYVAEDGALVGARVGELSLLREGWGWGEEDGEPNAGE